MKQKNAASSLSIRGVISRFLAYQAAALYGVIYPPVIAVVAGGEALSDFAGILDHPQFSPRFEAAGAWIQCSGRGFLSSRLIKAAARCEAAGISERARDRVALCTGAVCVLGALTFAGGQLGTLFNEAAGQGEVRREAPPKTSMSLFTGNASEKSVLVKNHWNQSLQPL